RKDGGIRNLDIIKAAYELYNSIKDRVQLTHVAGHAGIEGNELADRMAVLAAQSKQQDLKRYEGEMNVEKLLGMKAG
ncbi:MAG: RNase H family protein, partial [Steroidobacter sp.]